MTTKSKKIIDWNTFGTNPKWVKNMSLEYSSCEAYSLTISSPSAISFVANINIFSAITDGVFLHCSRTSEETIGDTALSNSFICLAL